MTEFLPWNATWWGVGCAIPYQNGQKLGISNEPQRCYAEASWLETLFLCVCWQCRLLLSTTVRGLYEWRMVAILQWLLDVIKKGLLCICDVYDAAFALCCKFQRAWIVKERCNVVLRSVGVSCVCVYAHCTSSQNCAMTSVFAVGKSFSWANAGDLVLIHCTYYFPSERKLWIIVCLLIWKVYDVVQDALRVLYVPWFIDVSTGDRTVCG